MTEPNENAPPMLLQRIGLWVCALAPAVLVTFVISGFQSNSALLRSHAAHNFRGILCGVLLGLELGVFHSTRRIKEEVAYNGRGTP